MNKDEFERLISDRSILIDSLENKLSQHIRGNEKILSKNIIEEFINKLEIDENGKIKNNEFNRNLLLKIDGIFKSFSEVRNPILTAMVVKQIDALKIFNAGYFEAFANSSTIKPITQKVNNIVDSWLFGGKNENGYINTIIDNRNAKIKVYETSLSILQGQKGLEESKKLMRDLIRGNEKLGVFERYYNQFLYDLNSQIDRAMSFEYAKNLDFKFALYSGGLIKTSRKFCIKHNGKVYHISEILDFKPKEAIPDNYNPIQDLGGYNCRHHLNWMSNVLAEKYGKIIDNYK